MVGQEPDEEDMAGEVNLSILAVQQQLVLEVVQVVVVVQVQPVLAM